MLDYLAIAVHELSSISERRIERLINPGESWEYTCCKIYGIRQWTTAGESALSAMLWVHWRVQRSVCATHRLHASFCISSTFLRFKNWWHAPAKHVGKLVITLTAVTWWQKRDKRKEVTENNESLAEMLNGRSPTFGVLDCWWQVTVLYWGGKAHSYLWTRRL